MVYSLDFRKYIFLVKEKEKLAFQEGSYGFSIPIRMLFRWQQCIELKTKCNKRATKNRYESVLVKYVKENLDSYQYE